jgi:hypothetical protein
VSFILTLSPKWGCDRNANKIPTTKFDSEVENTVKYKLGKIAKN